MAVITTGCGSASATVGSAVRLDAEVVLTAAHVVAGAGGVAVLEGTDLPAEREWPEFSPATLFETALEATIIAFDPGRDLALVSTGGPGRHLDERRLPEFGTAGVDTAIEIHSVTATEPVDGTVAERTTIVADGVRGGSRVERDGYRLEATTSGGDSGAGVWSADGRLVGLVFAVSSEDLTRTWAVSGREIEHFLDAARAGTPQSFRCDEEMSRLVVERPG